MNSRVAHDRRGVDLLGRAQHVHRAEALALQAAQPAAQLVVLAAQHVRPEVAVGPGGVARRADLSRQVQHDGDRQDVVIAGQLDERRAGVAAARSWRRRR